MVSSPIRVPVGSVGCPRLLCESLSGNTNVTLDLKRSPYPDHPQRAIGQSSMMTSKTERVDLNMQILNGFQFRLSADSGLLNIMIST